MEYLNGTHILPYKSKYIYFLIRSTLVLRSKIRFITKNKISKIRETSVYIYSFHHFLQIQTEFWFLESI